MFAGDFQTVVNLVGGFGQQEESAHYEYQIPAGNLLAEHAEPGVHQADDPGQAEQQGEAGEHGKADSQRSGEIPLSLRQPAYQDGDEDDVIDAQHDFERQKGRQRHPGLGYEYPLYHFADLQVCLFEDRTDASLDNLRPVHIGAIMIRSLEESYNRLRPILNQAAFASLAGGMYIGRAVRYILVPV